MNSTLPRGILSALMPPIRSLTDLSISDLRTLERSLQMTIAYYKEFQQKNFSDHDWLAFAPVGMRITDKADYFKAELNHCEMLLDKIQFAIRNT